jgi:hypothetical protein
MAQDEDIRRARAQRERIKAAADAKAEAEAKAKAKAAAKAEAKVPPNPNALADLQAGIAESKEQVNKKNLEIATIALEQAYTAGVDPKNLTAANFDAFANATTKANVAAAGVNPTENYTGRGLSNDPLKLNGVLFTGTRNNIEYKDGVVKNASRADILEADRNAAEAFEASNRAKISPLFNPKIRPAGKIDKDMIIYWSWVGGRTSGKWQTYRATATQDNLEKYGSRVFGGETQATFDSIQGVNALVKQPLPFFVDAPDGKSKRFIGYQLDGTAFTGKGFSTAEEALANTPTDTDTFYSDGSTGTGIGTGIGTGTGTGGTGGSGSGFPTGPSLARDTFKNTLALFFGATEASKPWADALYGAVTKFYRTGSSVDESFNLALLDARNNPALKPFTDRFKGIYALQDLKVSGKPVLVPTIAEYVVSQAKMADVLKEANLGSIATEEFTTELISKGNSVTTIADKIAKAYLRIDMAPKAIKDTLSRYFPTVDRTTLAKTLLLGEKGVNQLVDELEQYEVLAAAEQQGLGAINRAGGVTEERAKEYARTGGTFSSLLPKFGQIATALPTTTKLSQISKVEDVGQVGLEKAIISQSAKELEKLQELTEQEEARFRSKAGRAELGLASQRRANRAF